jgi:hypothetical protein
MAELGKFGKATQEYLDKAEELSKYQIGEGYGPGQDVFSVRGKGGTSLGGEQYCGRNYRVDLAKVECSCNVPQIMHAPYSHMITACKISGYDHIIPPYMSPLYLHSNTLFVWEKAFEPYVDPMKWPPYYGEDYVPHPELKKVGKGRRKKKRFKDDMDAMRGYGADKYGGGLFDETRSRNLWSICKEPGHNASRHRRQGQ